MYAGSLLLVAAISLLSACRRDKNNDTDTKEDTGYTTDQNLTEKIFDDAQTMSDKGAVVTGSGAFKTTACGSVTHAAGTFTIDFGSVNCLCSDGRNRRGKIIVNYTGAYADSGSVHTITFDNYYQNDNKVEGTRTVTNMGHNSAGQPYFNVMVNGTITKTDGSVITTNFTRTRTWTAGYTTLLNWTDDVYQITGAGTMTRPSGTVSVSITSPLMLALNCRWIQAGTIVYTLPSSLTRTLNYGATAACDDQATLTLPSGTVYTITLP
ncbi:hypothetical protein GCM10023093_22420 [Nemorincola caseinilytica]|uniref:Lipoprotein n=2 Tax=Nemorincola caseinilytica TaxID=2054315 RepID=A0ABP8NKD0_9BACT